jgi:DNA-binding MarR family transcriptional regulator
MENKAKKEITYELQRIDKMKRDFMQVPNNVFQILKGDFAAYTVYSYMIDKYNKNYNYAFPSLTTIMDGIGGSKPTIIKAIKSLEEKGLIKVIRTKESPEKNFANKYVVYFPIAINPLTKEEELLAPERIIITTTI